MSDSAKYVIIGNSTAAVGCIEGIRQLDKDGSIIVLSTEKYPAYSRPLISYLLEGLTTEKHMQLRAHNFYKINKVDFRPETEAVALDAKNKTVKLADGTTIGYEKLLNATGSRPFVPPMGGLDAMPAYFTFLTLDSAKAIEKVISKKSHVLIIGAGLIGMKCAEGIADRVADVTIVEMAPRCLPTNLEEAGSGIIQSRMEEHNVHFILGDSVKQFTPNFPKGTKPDSSKSPFGGTALTNNGTTVEFDVLICAVGVRPNTQLVEGAGGKVEKGIVIDENCRTTLSDVWAAGDCTLSYDISADTNRILAILPNAYMQGESAGINMAGGKKPYTTALPLNSAGFFGLHMVSAGSYTGKCIDAGKPAVKAHGDVPASPAEYRKFWVDNDLLKGFIIIGDVKRSGIYTSIVRDKIPLSTIDFDAIKDEPQLLAFSRQKRDKILSAKDDVPATSWNFAIQ
jgi:NAD(P)H-nitrite reductase large subunit